ncbi:MAG: hypothetical protein IOD12_06720 [Silvanigrellales bacterium]|nr:hypothetical protein [Silvanigrellales bacterium]
MSTPVLPRTRPAQGAFESALVPLSSVPPRPSRAAWALFGVVASACVCLASGCERLASRAGTSTTSHFFAFAEAPVLKPDPMVASRSRFRSQAFYKVTVQGVPLGTAVAARNESNQSFPTSVAMRLVHRLGASVVASDVIADASVNARGEDVLDVEHVLGLAKERLLADVSHFRRTQGLLVRESTPTSALPSEITRILSLAPALAGSPGNPPAMDAFAFFQTRASGTPKYVNPFTGLLVSSSSSLQFDDDGFLKKGTLPWHGALLLEFERVTEKVASALSSDILKTPVELGWFSTEENIAADLRRLQADAQSCATFSRDAESQVRKEFPQLPYLMHRRVFNFGLLCSRLFELLSKSESRLNASKTLDDVHWSFRDILGEDTQELPKSLLSHPDAPVLADASRKWLWARAASQILRGTHEELAGLIALERAQKVNLSLRVFIDTLNPGSVVKGVMRVKEARFKADVRTAQGNQASPGSWTRVPESLVKPVRLASRAGLSAEVLAIRDAIPPLTFELLHGQAFARGETTPVSAVCEAFQGRVGLDLGDAPNTIISGAFARGVWDDSMRLSLVREFAQRAGSHPSCRHVIFSVPQKLVVQVKAELETFDKNILQNESEFQISNRSIRRMRVQPGVYELTLTSLVSGDVIGTREIIVPEGKPSLAAVVKFP